MHVAYTYTQMDTCICLSLSKFTSSYTVVRSDGSNRGQQTKATQSFTRLELQQKYHLAVIVLFIVKKYIHNKAL